MPEETTEVTTEVVQDTSNSTEDALLSASTPTEPEPPASEAPPAAEEVPVPNDEIAAEAPQAEASPAPSEADESTLSQEPDSIDPYIDKAFETIQHECERQALDTFLRAHIKTFREEWDTWPDSAKDAYLHMMASQLLQRQASTIRIMMGSEYKLPVPSAQTQLFESIQQSQAKPAKCIPVLLLPPNLRPTYALKK